MKAASSALTLALALLGLLASSAPATADPSEADLAFKKGRDFLKAGNYAAACEQFAKSQSLDPQLGTEFNLGECEEKLGKLAAALAHYRDVADHDTNAQRRSVAIDTAAELDKRVPRVQLQLDPPTAPATVKLGALAVPCVRGRCDARVDRGHYAAVATAPGYRDATATVDVAGEGTTVIVKLELAPVTAAAPQPRPPAPRPPAPPVTAAVAQPAREPAEPPRSHRKLYAIGTVAAGGAALATGVVFGVLANSAWSDAKSACGGSTSCATPLDLVTAQKLENTANSRADVSTGLFLAGAALAAAGIVLYVTAPSESAVTVAPSGTGVSLSGSF